MVDLIVIGASTGGPRALLELLRATGKLTCPIVVAQHMPALFTAGLARHLATETGHDVVEGTDGMLLAPGLIVVAPGERDTSIARVGDRFVVRVAEPSAALVHPSVDILFHSALRSATRPAAVVLTGMGNDGAQGAAAFSASRRAVLAQDPGTCAVDGMPRAVIDRGHATEIASIRDISRQLMRWAARFDSPPV